MKAILVCVDYADVLNLTLPYNRHHFSEVMVVTTPEDSATIQCAEANNCRIHTTRTFYEEGAIFNKWKSLEEALDVFGRYGWLCIMDADVFWPKQIPDYSREVGCIYTPKRRMRESVTAPIPDEVDWGQYPLHRNHTEWAGYTQIFHANDPHLGSPPWHQTNWKHAGGADSFFQKQWPNNRKKRPPFEVLHIGEAGANWCGRVTNYVDGSTPDLAEDRKQALETIRTERAKYGNFNRERY